MKKILTIILLLTLTSLFILGCQQKSTSIIADELPVNEQGSEEIEISDSLNEVNDLDDLDAELEDINFDDLDNLDLE